MEKNNCFHGWFIICIRDAWVWLRNRSIILDYLRNCCRELVGNRDRGLWSRDLKFELESKKTQDEYLAFIRTPLEFLGKAYKWYLRARPFNILYMWKISRCNVSNPFVIQGEQVKREKKPDFAQGLNHQPALLTPLSSEQENFPSSSTVILTQPIKN